MADFFKWAYAIAEVLQLGGGQEFLKLYTKNVERQNEEAIAASPVATAVIAFMRNIRADEWEGTATGLLTKLKETVERENPDALKYFPKMANKLTQALSKLKTNLRDAGIDYCKKEASYATIVTLRKLPNFIATIATTTTKVENKSFNSGGNSGDTMAVIDESQFLSPLLDGLELEGCGDNGDSGDTIPFSDDDSEEDYLKGSF